MVNAMRRSTKIIAAAAVLVIGAGQYWNYQHRDGCRAYTPASGQLVAHAGGGLPDATYANNRAAMDLAARHGFTLIELDFMVRDGRLTLGHDGHPESTLSLDGLLDWLDRHPGVSIVTDFKTDNIGGLAELKKLAGARIDRFIPQIYAPEEFAPVSAMGYPAPILTVYRLPDTGWQDAANALPIRALTIHHARRDLARSIRHPVFLHTVNDPIPGYGLYTDCLIPTEKQA